MRNSKKLLILGKKLLGCPVEIEFSVNIFKDKQKTPEFHLLQIKPMVLTSTKSISFKGIHIKNKFFLKAILHLEMAFLII